MGTITEVKYKGYVLERKEGTYYVSEGRFTPINWSKPHGHRGRTMYVYRFKGIESPLNEWVEMSYIKWVINSKPEWLSQPQGAQQ